MTAFDGVKVFSATLARDREVLGERVTDWICRQPVGFEIVDVRVTQSSDETHHLIAISVFYRSAPAGVIPSKA